MEALSAPTSAATAKPDPLVRDAHGPGRRPGSPRVNRRAVPAGPLPDAVAIRSVIVPDPAPPYDGAPRAPRRTALAGRREAGARSGQGTRSRPAAVSDNAAASTAQRATPAEVPAAGTWPSQFAQVLAETLAGARPAEQLVPWTTDQARQRIRQLGPLLATAHRPRVRRVIVTSPAQGILEMTVIVGLGASVRAVAVRLERPGPDGRPPGEQPGKSRPRPAGQARTGPAAAPAPPGQPARGPQSGSGRWLCTAVEAA